MVKSRFSFLAYFQLFFMAGFAALGTFLLSHPNFGAKNAVDNIKPAELPAYIIFFIGIIFGYFFIRRLFILTVYPDRLVLLTRYSRFVLEKAEISRICLMGRARVLGNQGDALVIETTMGQSFSLPDQFCGNMPELKMSILEEYRPLVADAPDPRPAINLPAESEEEEFCGNHVLSMNGIFFYGLTAVFAWQGTSFSEKSSKVSPLIVLIPILGFAGVFGSQLYYFQIEGDVLVIKNHIFRWYRKEYPLQDIAQVVFEHVVKRSDALRIRTVDFGSKSYPAGSLRSRHWVAFAQALKERGIPVKNELFLEGLPQDSK